MICINSFSPAQASINDVNDGIFFHLAWIQLWKVHWTFAGKKAPNDDDLNNKENM